MKPPPVLLAESGPAAIANLALRNGFGGFVDADDDACILSSMAYGGTVKFLGAGMLLNTRPDKSYFEPWQGQ